MKGFRSGGDIRDGLTRERLDEAMALALADPRSFLPRAPDYDEDAGARPLLSRLLEYDVPGGKRPAALIAKALKRLERKP